MVRKAEITRKTKETNIKIQLNLDGQGSSQIETGIAFFDHMLSSFCRHGQLDLILRADGDLDVDFHHTVEDIGICLGQALKKALGNKAGIERFADASVPLDEALARVALDLSGRPFLYYSVQFCQPDDGSRFNPYLMEEFFRALVNNAHITLHIDLIRGNNSHHILESVMKAFGKALKKAVTINGDQIPSTKGML